MRNRFDVLYVPSLPPPEYNRIENMIKKKAAKDNVK